jgi:hypothetical protein
VKYFKEALALNISSFCCLLFYFQIQACLLQEGHFLIQSTNLFHSYIQFPAIYFIRLFYRYIIQAPNLVSNFALS